MRDVTDYIELAREIGFSEAIRGARQAWRGDELGGGLITPDFRGGSAGRPQSTVEILASYRFNPKLSVSAAQGLDYLKKDVPPDSFASILNDMGFEAKIAALDPHLKSVLYLKDWPTATQPTAEEEDRPPVRDLEALPAPAPVVDPPEFVHDIGSTPAAVVPVPAARPSSRRRRPRPPSRPHLSSRKPPPPS